MLENLGLIVRFYGAIGRTRLVLIFVGAMLLTMPISASIVIPLVVRKIIDTLERSRALDQADILTLALLYFGTFVLSYVGELVYVRNKFKAAQELREQAMEYSSYLPLRRIKEKGSGYFAKLIADQVNDAFIVLDYPFLNNIFMLLRTAVVLGITFSWDRRLFAVFAINAVFVASYSTIFNRTTRSLFSQGLELIRQILALIVESLENIHELWANSAIGWRLQRYRTLLSRYTQLAIRSEVIRVNLDKLLVDAPNSISRLLILWYGGYQVVQQNMSIGTLWAVWTYFGYAIEPLYVIKELSRITVQSAANIENVLRYLGKFELSYKQADGQEDTAVGSSPGTIVYEIRNVAYSAGTGQILDGISLTLRKGEVLGVVGLSGEGKSTLLNILLGFETDYSGQVKLLGRELRSLRQEEIFGLVGYHPQHIGIFNDTLENNILMGRPREEHKLERIISELALDHLRGRSLGEGGTFISGGEKQKVELARLFYGEKPIAIIDEPFSNVDLILEKHLLEKLASYLSGRSVILISHKLNVLSLASRLIILKDGRVIADGPRDKLMESDTLYRDLLETYREMAKNIS